MEASTALPPDLSKLANGDGGHGLPAEVTFGPPENEVTVPVYPQRHAYLTNRLGRTFADFAESGEDMTTENFAAFLGGQAYGVLAALIPALPARMPAHVFNGYPSAEAMEAGDYDESTDASPTFPQIVAAFETAWRVNRFDVLGKLKALVDPTLLQAWIRVQLTERLSTTSASEPPPSGESDRTSSGATDPTPGPNAD